MVQLMRVRGNGCVLYYPETFQHPELLRGGAGLVVDLDAPLEREWCKGQEYKLEPAPEGAKAARIAHPVARRLIAAWELAHPEEAKALAAASKVAPKPVEKPTPPSDDDLDESKRAARKPAKAGAA